MLIVDGVRRSFGPVTAVRNVSFTVPRGSVFGLLGPNGAGKTTTMRMILGIFPPDAGSVTWEGKSIDRIVRRRFGYLPEERGLYGKMPVREQITYFARLHGLDHHTARARCDAWIEKMDIAVYAKRPAGELSKGNQQKVQLACAAVHEPELLILDEPFSGLDPINAEMMLRAIEDLGRAGTTLVLSSHQMWQIESACDAFCIVGAGEVRARGTLAELRADFPTRTVRVAPDDPALRALFAERGFGEPSHSPDGALAYEVPASTDFGALLRGAAAVAPLAKFDRGEPSLHAIYVRALGSGVEVAA
jgi:ABC-2 type transport system ATP-binding protein